MVAITATSSATPSLQAAMGKTRLEQARREAAQAEATAQNLRAQADDAERDAQKSQEKVRDLAAKNQQSDATYALQPQGKKMTLQAATAALPAELNKPASPTNANPLKTNMNAAPVLNAQGQTTGRIVNLSA